MRLGRYATEHLVHCKPRRRSTLGSLVRAMKKNSVQESSDDSKNRLNSCDRETPSKSGTTWSAPSWYNLEPSAPVPMPRHLIPADFAARTPATESSATSDCCGFTCRTLAAR